MELLQLKYFYEVAKNQHVSNTAKRLHVAQPSLTQSIKRLEKELDVKLFRSSGRNIILTEYGEFLKKKIGPILEELDGIPDQLNQRKEQVNHTITLNVMAASTIITDAIIQYQEVNDHIHFKITQNKAFEQGDINIYTEKYPNKKEANRYRFSEKIYLATPRKGEFEEIETIDLFSLREKHFISLAGSKTLRQICDDFCIEAGFRPNIVFESDSPSDVKNLIAAKVGVGFWPQYSWGEIDPKLLKLVPISDPRYGRDIVFSCENPNRKQEVDKFYEFLIQYFERLKEKY